jgi:signal transduction histidine kinase
MAPGFAEIPFAGYKGALPGAWLLLAISLANAGAQVAALPAQILLTNAAQVRALLPEEAARHMAVRLRGVVVLEGGSLTLADETAAIYLEAAPGLLASFRRGDLIEAEGGSDPSKFAPVIQVTKAWKLGVAKLPEPQPVTYDDLLTGRLDAQWVEVSGVVRRIVPLAQNEEVWELWLATGGGQLPVRLSKAQGTVATVDSAVRLRGVCFYRFNTARQALNPVLFVPPDEAVVLHTPVPVEPYAVPLRSLSSLMQFNPQESLSHRLRVRGVVTHAELGEGFWLRDAQRGGRVRTRQKDHLEVGAEVEVLGFLTRGGYTPVLEDAVFRKVGVCPPPLPARLTRAAQALEHDADLVELDATIQEQWLALDGCRLALVDGTNAFSALLRLSGNTPTPRHWRPGSRVRVMGICAVNAGAPGITTGTMEPETFELLLRSPADLRILQPPPWWTSEHISWVLGIAVVVLLLVVAGVDWNHRRRLREQALARMKSEAEFAAVWNERNRMAREMHDTLAQGLGAISVHLELVKHQLPADSPARKSLEEVRQLARENLADARKSIWNLRSQVLENGDLATALGGVLHSLTGGTGVKSTLRVCGRPRRLAPVTENNLLRIGQEAITNAARHARAQRLEVALEFEERQVRLSVQDDGQGFNPADPPPSEGGFGLVGMRERTEHLHGDFRLESAPAKGTKVQVTLALSG